jgi:hypothetical protein
VQFEDASSRMRQAAESLGQRVRATWSHVIYPASSSGNESGTATATGFALDHSSVVNRAPGKPIPQVVYDKLKAAGVIVDELGPDTLLAELRKVWREDTPHVAVATLLDWFASYVYLSRLRDDATLAISIEKLLGKIESPVGFAKNFNEGRYEGVTQWSATLGTAIASGILVWRKALPVDEASATAATADKSSSGDRNSAGAGGEAPHRPDGKVLPLRFYGSIKLDPDKAGLQVAAIAKEVLFELTRLSGSSLKLSLEIEGHASSGYPDDVVEVVRANLRDLKIDVNALGFEEE